MTLIIERPSGEAGRSYTSVYDANGGATPSGPRATIGTLLVLLVVLVGLMVLYMPVLTATLVVLAGLAALGVSMRNRRRRWQQHA